ncbi:methylase involved in ubiquinone/menaquinone biosynthesis [Xenococcus sp. PCC 7305]|uniref:class I SAM-dependent methyltransferase n=1 Tax=Xenococcus sp. PCC 7305 TaxID=102125 RepID=UPI0002ABEB6E|nr:class I SAM-dependent methyltransferase [Xenococcus sp. PCC 7305]ELS03144.1 methylase involved in ubiquinone/menaquinone biosynthesis [Xenococcus sp. PCC 7305]
MSTEQIWEDFISLNSFSDFSFEVLEPAIAYSKQDPEIHLSNYTSEESLSDFIAKDHYPLPSTKDREGYFGNSHYSYWLSGLRDYLILKSILKDNDVPLSSCLDLGCASGRVIRHFGVQDTDIDVWGSDINYKHICWVQKYLPSHIKIFQNSSIPYIPLPDNSLDLVTAYSIFTHVESFDLAWMAEIRRILRPGGIAYITALTDFSLRNLNNKIPVYKSLKNHKDFSEDLIEKPMNKDKYIFRYRNFGSYSSVVFLNTEYISNAWSRMFKIIDIKRQFPGFQDAVIMQKI